MRTLMKHSDLFNSLVLLNSQLELRPLMFAVLDISLGLTGAERAFLLLYNQQNELSIEAARDAENGDLRETDFEGSRTIVDRVLNNREAVYIPKIPITGGVARAKSVQRLGLRTVMCLPLFSRRDPSRLIGVLYLDSSAVSEQLTPEHLELMKTMTNHVAIAVENARLFEELEQKNEEIARLNLELQRYVEMQAGSLAEMRVLLAEKERELGKIHGLGDIVGRSEPMQKVFKILEKVSSSEATVLILGESGTGKELVAKHIHYNGPRAENPLVSVNCSAFSETLLESELFGHRKGAFTGATENKIGLFQMADGGTLFLDEVGEMSMEMQKKLLRVLQEGEFRPIGDGHTVKSDVRILAATNSNLKEMMEQGKFRTDLYFRLNVINIRLPPLRERREDIPLLIRHFNDRIARKLNQPLDKISPEILQNFMAYDWPGNVRELQNELHRLHILGSEYEFEKEPSATEDISLSAAEKNTILRALEATSGNKTKAAELLGMSRRSFYDKLAKHNLM